MTVAQASLANGNFVDPATGPYVTSSVSPTGEVLLYLQLADAASISVSSVTGCGLTWTQVSDGGAWGTASYRNVVWKGVGTATSGTVTITFNTDPYTFDYFLVDVTGHSTSGMVVQTVTNSGNGTTASATLAAFSDANNATAAFATQNDNNGVTPGTGFTELAERIRGPFTMSMAPEFRNDPDTSPDATFGFSQDWFITAMEIAVAQVAGGLGAQFLGQRDGYQQFGGMCS